jgi:ketosteroid isomerase-like protein
MKKTTLLFVWSFLFCLACFPTLKAGNPEKAFGKKVVQNLKANDLDAMMALLMDASTVQQLMENAGESKEAIASAMADFPKELAKMQNNLQQAFTYFQKELGDKGLDKAKFLETKTQEKSNSSKFNRRDLYVIFKLGEAKYVLTADDCIETPNGWKMTGKFNIHLGDRL